MAAWNAASYLAVPAYGFVVARLLWQHAGEHGYGLWATVAALRGFVLFLDGGLAFGVARDAALAGTKPDEAAARIRATWRIYAALGALAFVVFAVAAGFPGRLLGLSDADAEVARGVTLLFGVEALVVLLGSPLLATLRGRQRFDALAAATWTQAVLGVTLLALLTPRYGLIGAALAGFASRTFVFGATWIWMRGRSLLPAPVPMPPGVVRSVLVFAGPLWLAAVGTQIGAGTDVPIVGGVYGAATAAQYALGALPAGIAAGLLFAVMGAAFPRMVASREDERPRMTASLLFLATFLAALGFGFLATHGESLLRVWVGNAPALAVTVGMIACLNWALNAPAHVLSSLAIARGVHRVVGPVVLVEALTNVALSFVLAATWSPVGPVVGTLVTIFVSNVLVVPALLRGRLGLSWTEILRPSLFGYGLGVAGAALVFIATDAAHAGPLVALALGIALTLAVAGVVLDLTVRGKSTIRKTLVLARRGGFGVVRRQRAEATAEGARLEAMRREDPIAWTGGPPLVTVRIATYNRGPLVAERAIASALAQTHQNVEVLVVGDHCDERTAAAVLSVKDPRVRFVNLPERGRYPERPELRWLVAGATPQNHAVEIARGEWIAPLDDDDEFTPDHVETLLEACRRENLEFAYGVAEMEQEGGTWTRCGAWPLRKGHVVHAAVLFSKRLAQRHDLDAWRLDEPGDWNLWSRFQAAGVRMGFVDRVVCRHYREARDVSRRPPFWAAR